MNYKNLEVEESNREGSNGQDSSYSSIWESEPPVGIQNSQMLSSQEKFHQELEEFQIKDHLYDVSKDEKKIIYKDEFKDKLTLSPIKKYSKYGKFPFKLLIHIGLMIFTTLQIDSSQQQFTPYSRQQDYQWLSLFYNDDNADNSNGIYTFYTIQDLQDHFKNLFDNLLNFNQDYFQEINLEKTTIFLSFAPNAVTKSDLGKQFQDEPIDPELGIQVPFDQNDGNSIKVFMEKTQFFQIQINNLALTLARQSQPFSCWNFALQYQLIASTFIQSILQADGKECLSDPTVVDDQLSSLLFEGSQIVVSIIIFLLAVSSAFLALKYIFDMISDYMHFKKKGQILIPMVNTRRKEDENEDAGADNLIKILSEQRPWDELSFAEKSQYFDLWFIVILLGNICQIISCLYIFLQNGKNNLASRLNEPFRWIQGMGCSLAWLTALKYFEYLSKFNITSELIKRSFPKIGKHFIGFIPILMSFIIVGMTSFGESQRFASFRYSLATLFSLLLGDSIHDITHDMEDNGISNPLAIIYIISFIIVFMLAVNNIMIAIIQEEGEYRKKRLEQEQRIQKMEKFKKKEQMARKIEEERLKLLNASYFHSPPLSPKKMNGNDKSMSESISFNPNVSNIQNEKKALDGQFKRVETLQDIQYFEEDEEEAKEEKKEDDEMESKEEQSLISPNKAQQSPSKQNILRQESSNVNLFKQQSNENPFKSTKTFENFPPPLSINKQVSQESEGKMEMASSPISKKQLSSQKNTPQNQQMSESQKSKISLKALTKIAIQLKKQKSDNSTSINIQEQFQKEVDLMTEKKLSFRQYYKQFQKGFNEAVSILDKQAYEIKDNLYLYKLTREQYLEIVSKYCSALQYFIIQCQNKDL